MELMLRVISTILTKHDHLSKETTIFEPLLTAVGFFLTSADLCQTQAASNHATIAGSYVDCPLRDRKSLSIISVLFLVVTRDVQPRVRESF